MGRIELYLDIACSGPLRCGSNVYTTLLMSDPYIHVLESSLGITEYLTRSHQGFMETTYELGSSIGVKIVFNTYVDISMSEL